MWTTFGIFLVLLFVMISRQNRRFKYEGWIICGLLIMLFQYLFREGFINGQMPDSSKTSCAKGSVPATNGLDCKLPKDIYGL